MLAGDSDRRRYSLIFPQHIWDVGAADSEQDGLRSWLFHVIPMFPTKSRIPLQMQVALQEEACAMPCHPDGGVAAESSTRFDYLTGFASCMDLPGLL